MSAIKKAKVTLLTGKQYWVKNEDFWIGVEKEISDVDLIEYLKGLDNFKVEEFEVPAPKRKIVKPESK